MTFYLIKESIALKESLKVTRSLNKIVMGKLDLQLVNESRKFRA